jgi:hypothetical protein
MRLIECLVILIFLFGGCTGQTTVVESGFVEPLGLVEPIDCADGDWHWGGFYPTHSGEINDQYIHLPSGSHCIPGWCKTCDQSVCVTLEYFRH